MISPLWYFFSDILTINFTLFPPSVFISHPPLVINTFPSFPLPPFRSVNQSLPRYRFHYWSINQSLLQEDCSLRKCLHNVSSACIFFSNDWWKTPAHCGSWQLRTGGPELCMKTAIEVIVTKPVKWCFSLAPAPVLALPFLSERKRPIREINLFQSQVAFGHGVLSQQ